MANRINPDANLHAEIAELRRQLAAQDAENLVELLPTAVYTCDADGRIVRYNEAAARLWQRSPAPGEMWCGSYKIFSLDGEPVPLEECPMAIALKEGRTFPPTEIIVEMESSDRRTVLVHPRPFLDAEGKVTGAINMLVDITEQKRTQTTLSVQVEAMSRLHALSSRFSSHLDLHDGLEIILSTAADLASASQGLISVFNPSNTLLTLAASVGFTDAQVAEFSDVDPTQESGVCATTFAKSEAVIVEDFHTDERFKSRRADAERAGVRSVHSSPIMTRRGEIVGTLTLYFAAPLAPDQHRHQVLGICALHAADLIEAEHAHQAVRESNDRFQQMANHAPMMVWVSEPDGATSFLSKSWYEFTGQTPDSALGFQWARAMHPEDMASTRATYENAVADRAPFQIEYRLLRGDGTYRWMLDSAAPRFSDEDTFLGYIGSVIDITDRKGAEDRLREEAHFSDTLNRVSQSLIQEPELSHIVQSVTDEGTRLTGAQFGAFFYNVIGDRGEEYMLYTLSGVPIENFSKFPMPRATAIFAPTFHGEGVIRLDDVTQDARYGKSGPYHGMPEGHLPVRSYLAVPVITSSGEVIGGLFFGHADIGVFTERHEKLIASVASQAAIAMENARLYERVQDTANRLSLAFEASQMGDWNWSYETDIVALSDRASEIFGASESMSWTDMSQLLAPEDRDRIVQAVTDSVENNSPYHVEYRINRTNGTQVWVMALGRPIYDAENNLIGMSGIVQDITERKLTEAALAVSEDQFRTLANTFSHLAWMARPNGDIFWFNHMWFEFTGRTLEESKGRGWTDSLDPADTSRVLSKYMRHLKSGEPWEDTFRLRRHDGEMAWHLSRMRPVRDARGDIILWFGTNTDISEQREADRRKDEFLAMLAHELRNPLAPLRNGLEVLKFAQSDPSTFESMRGMMERQVEHMVRLVDDLMDVSRISRGVIQLRIEPVRLADVMRSAIETSQPLVDSRRQRLDVSLPDEKAEVFADATRLAQVFANLLNNASKYSPPETNIAFEAKLLDGRAVISVADQGIGITPDAINRVFEMFAQVDSARESAQGGLGIGLHLARRLTEMQGGTIHVVSDGPGKGSVFSITLPLRVASKSNGTSHQQESKPKEQQRILIVDDNHDAANTLAHLLREFGHEVAVAYGGADAVRQADRQRPNVVIMDIGMPDLDGNDAARQIRRQPWGRDVTLAALTGWGTDEDRARTREAGFDYHFVKPVQIEILRDTLDV
jgi:PAS domain S-box-containing protein